MDIKFSLGETKRKCKKKSLPRGIEPRSPALIGINDKRKSSPLDQGRCDGRVTARPLGWLMEVLGHLDLMSDVCQSIYPRTIRLCTTFKRQLCIAIISIF
ncbi:hypothetical protein N7449_004759 [Penicillium cf. viridicatum]|uniref:Uncharacterized protein n=1 Tax=Penicillium cf. viridicatum TaxID=2972119 RepID=A0A9W9MJV3_9EURO|nr:hypothetical protein N7449_004759 [Penicillium cf. viridicatum]